MTRGEAVSSRVASIAALMRVVWLDPLVWIGSLLVLVYASAQLAPSVDELAFLERSDRAAALVERAASQGFGSLFDDTALAGYQQFGRSSPLVLMFGAWIKLSLGRLGLIDLLSAQRAAWLLMAAFGPWALYRLLLAPTGRVVALTAASLWLFTPRWLHGAVTGHTGAIIGALWMLVTLLYFRARQRRGRSSLRREGAPRFGGFRAGWALLAGVVFGVALTVSLAALWLLPILLAHGLALDPQGGRSLRRGRVPVPAAWVALLLVGAAMALLLRPELYRTGVVGAATFALAQLSPDTLPGLDGPSVSAWLVAPVWLATTTPSFVLLFACSGLWQLLGRHRFAAARRAPAALMAPIGLGLCLAIAMFAPPCLLQFPPPSHWALGYLAMAAGFGVSWAVRAMQSRGWLVPLVATLSAAVIALVPVSSSGAAVGWLLGRPWQLLAGRPLALDGSEIAGVVPRLEAVTAGHLRLGTEYPQALFDRLHDSGRLERRVTALPPGQGEWTLERGAASGFVVLGRGLTPIWSLREVEH